MKRAEAFLERNDAAFAMVLAAFALAGATLVAARTGWELPVMAVSATWILKTLLSWAGLPEPSGGFANVQERKRAIVVFSVLLAGALLLSTFPATAFAQHNWPFYVANGLTIGPVFLIHAVLTSPAPRLER